MYFKKPLFLLVCTMVIGLLPAQYNPDNHVVTLSKYYLEPLSSVENGSAEERKEVMEENAKKMNPLKDKLLSTMVLGHYWTGTSNEVLVINEWASIADADETIRTTADTRKKAWRKYKENTFVSITQYNLARLSTVEEGSAEERKEMLQTHFDKIVKKNNRIISSMFLQHYWSGSAGGPEGWPVIIITEYASIEDALDEDDSALWEAAWPDEEEREAFRKKFGAYWSKGKHTDLELRTNWVALRK